MVFPDESLSHWDSRAIKNMHNSPSPAGTQSTCCDEKVDGNFDRHFVETISHAPHTHTAQFDPEGPNCGVQLFEIGGGN